MCCLRIEPEMLLYNCFKNNGSKRYRILDLKKIVPQTAMFFGQYIFCNLSFQSIEKVMEEFPGYFSFVYGEELMVQCDASPDMMAKAGEYFNLGYPMEVVEKITEFAHLIE